jgi:alkaline phosphatase D
LNGTALGQSLFQHGVASGDPLTDRVVLWTRVTPAEEQPITVRWTIALDTAFGQAVSSGTFVTDAGRDYTVKVDAGNLNPDTWYYYRFEALGKRSVIGRTRTLPQGDVRNLRVAVLTCSNYTKGFFNVYARVGERNDLDAVLHLGDYIYENDNRGNVGRPHEPPVVLKTVDEFRQRYSQYRTDPDLQYAHQQYPWFNVWDDHETSNNAWQLGSATFTPAEFASIKQAGIQAYFEWLPIREQAGRPGSIYRSFDFGNLARLICLDTRIEGRMQQVEFSDTLTWQDTSRTILGMAQARWLTGQLDSSTAQWQVLAQQVIMAPLKAFGNFVNKDQWDGYPRERNRLFEHFRNNPRLQPVVLTGDFHASWANDLPAPNQPYDSLTQATSVGVEFVTPAVAANAGEGGTLPFFLVRQNNPHVQYAEFTRCGYLTLDLTPQRARADFYLVPTIKQKSNDQVVDASWENRTGERFLRKASGNLPLRVNPRPLAPARPGYSPTSLHTRRATATALLGVFPNPTTEHLTLQLVLDRPAAFRLTLLDGTGRAVYTVQTPTLETGTPSYTLPLPRLSAGTYHATVACVNPEIDFKPTYRKIQIKN